MQFIVILVLMILMEVMRPVPAAPRRPGLNEFQHTTAEQDRRIPVFWGKPWLKGPNLVWFGDYKTEKIKKKIKGLFVDKTQVIGYKYFLGFHLVFGYGDGNVRLLQINAGKDTIWTGNLSGGRGEISEYGLWGGDDGTGGIGGKFTWLPGGRTQMPSTYLQRILGDQVPGYRGVCSLVWEQGYIGNQTSVQQWEIQAQRLPAGLLSGFHDIDGEANPAEIQFEILTNKDWGLGETDIDQNNFREAAATLAAEKMGISLNWDQAKSLEDMLKEIDRHIDAVTYRDPVRGLWVMKLIRNDYTINSLLRANPSNSTLVSFNKPSGDEMVNEMKVIYSSEEFDGKPVPVQIQDDAAYWNRNNQKVSSEVAYPGFTKKALALFCCTRDLRALSYPFARVQMTMDRSFHSLRPASRFVLDWAPEGITNMVMIVLEKDIGTLKDGRITVTAVQDAFGVGSALYTETDSSGWVAPDRKPKIPLNYRMEFSPYWLSLQDPDIPSPEAAVPLSLVESPSGAHLSYDMDYTDPALGGVFTSNPASEAFTPTATLLHDYLESGGTDTSGTLVFSAMTSPFSLQPASVADIQSLGTNMVIIDNEWMALGNMVERSDGTWLASVVYRGLLDTTISRHLAGTKVWFVGEAPTRTPTQLSPFRAGTYKARIMPRALAGVIASSVAPIMSITTDGGVTNARPLYDYPPRDLALNGSKVPGKLIGDSIAVTWENSNRVTETTIKFHGDPASVKPGATRYKVRLYNDAGTLLLTSPDLFTTGYTFGVGDILGGMPASGYVQVTTINALGVSQAAVIWFGRQVDYEKTQDAGPQRLIDEAGPWAFLRMSD